MEDLQLHTALLLIIFIASLLFIFTSQHKKEKKVEKKVEKEVEKEEKPVRKEAADDEDADDDDEEDFEKPALDDHLEHIPFQHEILPENEMITRSAKFYSTMDKRRTLRFFSSQRIPRQVIDNIVLAAATSPSGAHTEPWTYVVVEDAEVKEKVREIVEEEEEKNYSQRMGSKWTTDLRPLKTDWVKPYLTTAPYIVLLFKQTYGLLPNGKKRVHYYNEISTSISAGIFLAAVQWAGLVTLTSTPLNCGPALRRLLGRPENEKLVMLLPLGYPAQDATVPALKRKTLDEVRIYV